VRIQLHESDAATSTTTNIGDELAIDLSENPTTGYRWELELDTARLELREDRYETHSSTMVGGGGQRHWIVAVKGLGPTTLRFKLCRSWEAEGAIRRLAFEVLVV
jgi:inhibitor of cysteine peptidase